MKINITLEPNDIGMRNISIVNGDNPFELPVENNECTLIIADTILDYISFSSLKDTLVHYVSKLRHKGTLIIGGTDLIESSKILLSTQDLESAVINIFGTQEHPWKIKRACYSAQYIKNILENLKLKILHIRYNAYNFAIEAYRD